MKGDWIFERATHINKDSKIGWEVKLEQKNTRRSKKVIIKKASNSKIDPRDESIEYKVTTKNNHLKKEINKSKDLC